MEEIRQQLKDWLDGTIGQIPTYVNYVWEHAPEFIISVFLLYVIVFYERKLYRIRREGYMKARTKFERDFLRSKITVCDYLTDMFEKIYADKIMSFELRTLWMNKIATACDLTDLMPRPKPADVKRQIRERLEAVEETLKIVGKTASGKLKFDWLPGKAASEPVHLPDATNVVPLTETKKKNLEATRKNKKTQTTADKLKKRMNALPPRVII
jgi:hypothetical protein